jgi:hypothetical protein
MSEVCPNCEIIVGKLYRTCRFCHMRYCDDCVPPDKHYCPQYREGTKKVETQTNVNPIISSKDACDDFAKKYTENEDEVPFLTLRDIKKRVSEGIGTLDSYICPRCINTRDTERYACIHCKTERNIKCDWCGNHFCEVCVKPKRHECLEYERHLRKSSYTKSEPEPVPEPVTEPIPEPVAKPTPEPIQVSQNNQIEEKLTVPPKSLWGKIRSTFGM